MKVIVASRSGCPASMEPPPPNELRETTAEELVGCKQRNEWVVSTLVPQADLVVMADLRAGYADGSRPLDGYVDAITRVRAAGKQVIWLSDVPLSPTASSAARRLGVPPAVRPVLQPGEPRARRRGGDR